MLNMHVILFDLPFLKCNNLVFKCTTYIAYSVKHLLNTPFKFAFVVQKTNNLTTYLRSPNAMMSIIMVNPCAIATETVSPLLAEIVPMKTKMQTPKASARHDRKACTKYILADGRFLIVSLLFSFPINGVSSFPRSILSDIFSSH